MFLTKKSLIKICLITFIYFAVATESTVLSFVFDAKILRIIGIIMYLLCVGFFFIGRYTEGAGNLLNLGNKLVRRGLRPRDFLNTYESTRKRDDLVINKPSFDVLRLAETAYNLTGDKEKCLETIDEMIAVAPPKKKTTAVLIKASHLFELGRTDEAELLLADVQSQTLTALDNVFYQLILQTDRAIAMGDFKVAEAAFLRTLDQPFPKPDNLSKLICHYTLGEIYEKLGDTQNALGHYGYCAQNGGQTALRKSAEQKLLAKAEL